MIATAWRVAGAKAGGPGGIRLGVFADLPRARNADHATDLFSPSRRFTSRVLSRRLCGSAAAAVARVDLPALRWDCVSPANISALALVPSLIVCLAWDFWVEKEKAGLAFARVDFPRGAAGCLGDLPLRRIDAVLERPRQHGAARTRAAPVFFMGRHGTSGWLLYFPVALLLKTPLRAISGQRDSRIFWRERKNGHRRCGFLPRFFLRWPVCRTFKSVIATFLVCYPFLIVAVAGIALSSTAVFRHGPRC